MNKRNEKTVPSQFFVVMLGGKNVFFFLFLFSFSFLKNRIG